MQSGRPSRSGSVSQPARGAGLSSSRRYVSATTITVRAAGNTAAVVLQSYYLRLQAEDSTRSMQTTYSATVDSWRRALELRDRATEGHGMRVAEITVQLAVTLGVDPSQLSNIRFGAQLHDIGKIGVPDNILLKPGPLDKDDFEVMKQHPVYAYEMLYSIPNFNQVLDIPYCHHEKWDGTGYPEGLAGDEIPLPARIFAVVDVWDALNSARPYRPAWPQPEIITYLQAHEGDRVSRGEVLVRSKPVEGPGADRGMVFQKYSSFPYLTVLKNVCFGMELNRERLGLDALHGQRHLVGHGMHQFHLIRIEVRSGRGTEGERADQSALNHQRVAAIGLDAEGLRDRRRLARPLRGDDPAAGDRIARPGIPLLAVGSAPP